MSERGRKAQTSSYKINKSWGCDAWHGDCSQKKIRGHHRAAEKARASARAPASPLMGACSRGCALGRICSVYWGPELGWDGSLVETWPWSLHPHSRTHTPKQGSQQGQPDKRRLRRYASELTAHLFVEHFSGTENLPVWARNKTLPSRSLFI